MPRKKSETPKEQGKNIKVSLSTHKLLKVVATMSGHDMGSIIEKVMNPWLTEERERLFAAERESEAK